MIFRLAGLDLGLRDSEVYVGTESGTIQDDD